MTIASQISGDSPYLWWPLDDTSGTTADDDSGNARHGTYGSSGGGSPTPSLDAGDGPDCDAGTNRSVEWNGVESDAQRVSINDRPASGSNPTMSVEAFVNIDKYASGERCVFSLRGVVDVTKEISVVWNVNSQTMGIRWCNVSTSPSTYSVPTKRGCWQHVAITSDGTTRRLWVDGNEINSWTGSHTLSASTQLWYGADGRQALVGGSTTTYKPWDGRIAHCAAYASELSSTDIADRVGDMCGCAKWNVGFVQLPG